MNDQQFVEYGNLQAPQIDGWFFPPDMLVFFRLAGIQRSLGITGSLCELGVWHGKSLVLMSHFAADSERCFGYDLFPGDLKDRAWANVQRFGKPEVVELVACDSATLTMESLMGGLAAGVRFLHIDAGHEYHEVMHQLVLFAPFVLPGGIIAMDDYHDREFPGIESATLDFAEIDRPRRFVPFFSGGNKMYLCEPHRAKEYQQRLLSIEPIASTSRVSRVRDFTVLVGFSKLPTSREKCLLQIAELAFPYPYRLGAGGLAQDAARYSQLKFGTGQD